MKRFICASALVCLGMPALLGAAKVTSAMRVSEAFKDLSRGKFEHARGLAKVLKQDSTYADYGYWIAGRADQEEGQRAFEKKQKQNAKKLFEQAIREFARVAEVFPSTSLDRPLVESWIKAEIGMAHVEWQLKHERLAQEWMERAFQRTPNKGQFLAYFRGSDLAAYASSCQRKKSEACQAWTLRVLNHYPRASNEAKQILQSYPDINVLAQKAAATERLTQSFKAQEPDSVEFEKSVLPLILDGKLRDLREPIEKFLEQYGRSGLRFRAKYWLAKSYQDRGDSEKAKALWENVRKEVPLGYYGLLSSFALGKDAELTAIPIRDEITAEDALSFPPVEWIKLKRAQAFLSTEGGSAPASLELKEIRSRDGISSNQLWALVRLNFKAQNYLGGFGILTELIQRVDQRVATQDAVQLIFPRVHETMIRKAAEEQSLDPLLVTSLIKQESAFDGDAISSSGAMGLMQIMPFTAIEVDSKMEIRMLHDPVSNIRTGTRYLASLLRRYGGNVSYSLAAYNAGPAALDRWNREGDGKREKSLLIFIESIPYRETRDYVSSILRNYYWYTRLIQGKAAPVLDVFWKTTEGSVGSKEVLPTPASE